MLHETIRNNNIATLCCAKNRLCESSCVTLPLVVQNGIVVVQNNGNERQKSLLHVQICFFFLIRSIDVDAIFIAVPF